ncbi:hypothetical protein TCAL_08936 [Tigriopus californicus]|uniref:VWFC domain-containing protein n=1 Tax=Tigriopus californicus TaxID=6832 RepID=A0A553PQP5_TIGCA|nr:hypothetical protein TCAL_08936 [Tigriopus californicus]
MQPFRELQSLLGPPKFECEYVLDCGPEKLSLPPKVSQEKRRHFLHKPWGFELLALLLKYGSRSTEQCPSELCHEIPCPNDQIHKKRRIVGRVRCKNIRAECPSPTCGSPVLLPGRCCKVCPGQENNPDEKISVDLAREEEEKNSRHYGSLLTSESMPKTSLVATGRFYFRKKTLSYSFVTGQEFGHPKFISFLDENGNIVEEFLTQTNEFHNITGKICGSWNRLPRRYRRQLRKDLLFAQLTNAEGATISGRIGKHFGLSSEYFSGLLLPISGSGFGSATAIVSTDSTSSTAGGVHIMILMKDVFGPTDDQDVTLDVKLEAVMDNGERRIIEDTLRVPKVVPKDATTSDLKTGFDVLEMDALGRGNLKMTVSSRNFPHYGVEGYLGSRFSCDLVDSILSPVDEDSELDEIAAMDHQNSPQRGLAWLVPKTNGELDYHIQIEDLSSNEITALQIDNGKMSRRLLMTIPLKATFNGGEASGSIRISAKEMEQLFKDNLFLNVATLANERALRGKLTIQMMSEATETIRPILLKSNLSLVSGIAWTSINAHCRLNYEMRLIGPERKTESTLTLKDFPMKNLKNLAMMPGRQLALQTFRGPTVSGHQDNLHKLSVARLDGGDASFVIRHEGHYEFEIEGRIKDVQAPPDCLPRYVRNELELMPGFLSDLGEERPEVEKELAARCLYEGGIIYEDGAQWPASHTNCHMCFCQRGKVNCDPVVCPKIECSRPIIHKGACCPVCQEEVPIDRSRGCQIEGDDQFHVAGSRWHPYIPPSGFSRCATCECHADTLEVKCTHEHCPKLDCPKDDQVREDTLACCKTCQEDNSTSTFYDPSIDYDQKTQQDMGREFTDEDILDMGGCNWKGEVRTNGESWHPHILPFGEYTCVTCTCKEGKTKCQRKSCVKLNCIHKVTDPNGCCPRCAANSSEVKEAKRHRRQQKLKKLRRMRQKIREQKRLLVRQQKAGSQD